MTPSRLSMIYTLLRHLLSPFLSLLACLPACLLSGGGHPVSTTDKPRQTLLFSATFSHPPLRLPSFYSLLACLPAVRWGPSSVDHRQAPTDPLVLRHLLPGGARDRRELPATGLSGGGHRRRRGRANPRTCDAGWCSAVQCSTAP